MNAQASFDSTEVFNKCMERIRAIEAKRKRLRKTWIINTVNEYNNAWYNKLLHRRMTLRDGVKAANREEKVNLFDTEAIWLYWNGQLLVPLRRIAMVCLLSNGKVILDQDAVNIVF